MRACPENVIIQTSQVNAVAGVPIKVAKCSGGQMLVEEIAAMPLTANTFIQFFEGQPPVNSLGNAISLNAWILQNALWSKPGKVVKDDVYMICSVTNLVSVEVRSLPFTIG
jgi:hypothetical protein